MMAGSDPTPLVRCPNTQPPNNVNKAGLTPVFFLGNIKGSSYELSP
jgi:hypothetical protein